MPHLRGPRSDPEVRLLLSIGKLAPGAGEYYLEAVAQGVEDYYLGAGEAAGVWLGLGARALGLEGEVSPDDLRAVLAGLAPNGKALARAPAGRERVPGYDLTLSAPKSVSLIHALGNTRLKQLVVAADDEAVRAALDYLEREAALLRRGHGGREQVAAEGLVAAAFRHRVSRALDPALHTHVLVANVARSGDGRSGALDGRALYRHQTTAGYLYQAELRHRLSVTLGVEWGPMRRGMADLAGVPREVVRAFSRRRAQIEAALAARGTDSRRAAEVAALATRAAKADPALAHHLLPKWRARAEELGFGPRELAGVLGRIPGPERDQSRLQQLLAELTGPEGLTRQASTFTRPEVVRALAAGVGPGHSARGVEGLADAFLASTAVIEVAAERGLRRFTTPELLRLEAELVAVARARQHVGAGRASEEAVRAALARRPTLSPEQVVMVERLTLGSEGVAVVQGRAGSGKTYALDPAREAWEASGHRVIGCALAARAASELQAGAGIPATTIARQLHLFLGPRLDARTVLVVDEAAMVGTRQMARLIQETARVGAKLVLVGDSAQLPEIGAGGAFRGLAERLEPIVLEGNVRQREAWERQALLDLREGRPELAVEAYGRAGRITLAPTGEEARQALVADWLAARAEGGDLVMVVARRRDADDLSRRARAELVAAGVVRGPELSSPRGPLAQGDRVLFERNDRWLRVQNGLRGEIESVDAPAGALVVRTDAGARVRVSPRYLEAGHLGYGYALTTHKAQGLSVDRAFVLGGDDLYREWGYTAFSRARVSTRLYLVGGEGMRQRLDPELGGRHAEPSQDALTTLTHDLRQSRAQRMSMDMEM